MIKLLSKKHLLMFAFCATTAIGYGQSTAPTYRLVAIDKPQKNTNNNSAKDLSSLVAAEATLATSTLQDRFAAMIKVVPQALSNVDLYKYLDQWLGVKYLYGGTSKSGIDCSAFVQKVYENVFGMSLVRTAWQQFNSCLKQKSTADLKEGDLVFFSIKSSRITHVGIYLKNNYFIHAACSKGVSVSNLSDAYWSKYYVGGGKIPTKGQKDISGLVDDLKDRL